MTATHPTPTQERFQSTLFLLLHAAGYAPLKVWAVEDFIFATFSTEKDAQAALATFQRVRWVLDSELKHEEDGTPYVIVRH